MLLCNNDSLHYDNLSLMTRAIYYNKEIPSLGKSAHTTHMESWAVSIHHSRPYQKAEGQRKRVRENGTTSRHSGALSFSLAPSLPHSLCLSAWLLGPRSLNYAKRTPNLPEEDEELPRSEIKEWENQREKHFKEISFFLVDSTGIGLSILSTQVTLDESEKKQGSLLK